jgi:hypothetical protein
MPRLQRLRPIAGSSAANTYNRTSHDGWAVGGVSTLFVTATDPGHSNPGGMNNLFFESPGSEHLGGCFFALADGSVQWISEFIDAKDNNALFPLLGSIQDGAVAGLAAASLLVAACGGSSSSSSESAAPAESAAASAAALAGKVGSAMTSSATQHGGQEATLLGFLPTMLHHGMIVVGLPYAWAGQSGVDEIRGGSPYGATTITHSDGSRQPAEHELGGARFQGKHVAEIAAKLAK